MGARWREAGARRGRGGGKWGLEAPLSTTTEENIRRHDDIKIALHHVAISILKDKSSARSNFML